MKKYILYLSAIAAIVFTGCRKIETDGEFDPNVHNAVMQVDSENHESGQIVSELQKGYMLKDRLLRPSMVSIAN